MSTLAQADIIVGDLQARRLHDGDISALFPDKHGTRDFAHEKHTKAPEGATAGASAGGAVGGPSGCSRGIGALADPGARLHRRRPIMAALSGAAAGAALGGVTGALIGLGIPEVEAKQYEGKIKGGNILISVHVNDSNERALAKQILERSGATDIAVLTEEGISSKQKAVA